MELNSTLDNDGEGSFVRFTSTSFALLISVIVSAFIVQWVVLRHCYKKESKNNSKSFTIDLLDLSFGNKLGSGAFATVYTGKWRGMEVAIKRFHQTTLSRVDAIMEVVVLSELRHPNCVMFLGACLDSPPVCIVTELLCGSLFDTIQLRADSPLPWSTRLRILTGAARGMQYLHESGMIHRDLKSPNLLLDKHHNCKVADFGMTTAPNSEVQQKQKAFRKGYSRKASKGPQKHSENESIAEVIQPEECADGSKYCSSEENVKSTEIVAEEVKSTKKVALSRLNSVKSLFINTANTEEESTKTLVKSPLASVRRSISVYFNHDKAIALEAAASAAQNAGGGTPMWCAPELLRGGSECNFQTDVYSFGIVIAEVANWSDPYPGISEISISYKVLHEALRPLIPLSCPEPLQDIMRSSWDNDPTKRGDFGTISDTLDNLASLTGVIESKNSSSFRTITNMLSGPRRGSSQTIDCWKQCPVVLSDKSFYIPRKVSTNGEAIGEPRDLLGSCAETTRSRLGVVLCRGMYGQGKGWFSTSLLPGNSKSDSIPRTRDRSGSLKARPLHGQAERAINNNKDADTESVTKTPKRKDRRSSFAALFQTKSSNLVHPEYSGKSAGSRICQGYVAVRMLQFRSLAALTTSSPKLLDKVTELAQLDHENILPLYGVYKHDTDLCLVCPYSEYGSVKDQILGKSKSLTWGIDTHLAILKHVACALVYLHNHVNDKGDPSPIIHKRLKSSNIILVDSAENNTENNVENVQIVARVSETAMSDLYQVSGLGRLCDNSEANITESGYWSAPEVILLDDYSTSSDIYSFGMLMWEMMHRTTPFIDMTPIEIARNVTSKKCRPSIRIGVLGTDQLEDAYVDLMQKCWASSATDRPSANELVVLLSKISS